MSDSFDQATVLTRVSAREHDLMVPDGWQVGRGAFGGLVLGATLAAIVADEPEAARLPRAFLGEVCAPLMPGAARLQTRALRRGNNQSNIACDLTQAGQVVAHGSAVLATSRKIGEGLPRPPHAPPPRGRFEDAAVLPFGPPDGPAFFQHYEPRPTSPLPFSGKGEGVVTGWIRERVPLARLTHAALLARLDAYWPVMFTMETRFRPSATVSFMAEFLVDPATLDPTRPLFYRARLVAELGGYVVEFRELWDGDQPVAFNQQTFALLG
jgi:acyl-CoA thioesterase